MSKDCDVIFIFQIFGHFGGVCWPDPGHRIFKTMFSLIVTFSLTKAENRIKKSLTLFRMGISRAAHGCGGAKMISP